MNKITIMNSSAHPVYVIDEPIGDYVALSPGQKVSLQGRMTFDGEPLIQITGDKIGIFDFGDITLTVEE